MNRQTIEKKFENLKEESEKIRIKLENDILSLIENFEKSLQDDGFLRFKMVSENNYVSQFPDDQQSEIALTFFFSPECGWEEKLEELYNLEETKEFQEIVFEHGQRYDDPQTTASEMFLSFIKSLDCNKDYFVEKEDHFIFDFDPEEY